MGVVDPIQRLNAALEGRYRIERELGAGGMATVYGAEDLRHRRRVALKVLKPELAAVVGGERFLSEIETTAGLQHPHILPLFDSGEAEGFLFYVMPYVEGESLRERLDRQHQLPVSEAVDIASKVAAALDYAHGHGVVHRDIKPANVLLSETGEPLVADFGIALAVSAGGGSRLTETGLSLGTPHYMSPEQATGDLNVGPQSDIWSLGCVLYEMLVGEPPFTGSTPQAVLGRIITGDVPTASSERASVPPNVDAVVALALEKVPADRFRTARGMAAALSDPGFRGPGSESGAGGRGVAPRFWPAAMLTLWAVIATTFGVWALTRPDPTRPIERWTVSDPIFGRMSGVPAVAPDGAVLVPTLAGELWLKEVDALEPRPIAEDGDLAPYGVAAFSPTGDRFVFIADGRLRIARRDGSTVATLADSAFCCPRWERDGHVYFTGERRGIERVPADGGAREIVTELGANEVDPHSDFALLPGGRAGVFYRWGPTLEARIEAVELEDGRRTPLIAGRRPYLAPDGRLVYWQAEELRTDGIDVDGLTVAGAPVTVERGVPEIVPGGYPFFALSSAGDLALPVTSMRGDVRLFWLSRSGAATPVDPGWSYPDPGLSNLGWSLSPDEDRIATFSAESGSRDIWIKDLPDGPFYPLTFHPALDVNPAWSPDGLDVLFVSDRAGGVDLWSKRADGSDEATPLYDFEGVVAYGRWTPNREWLVMRTVSWGFDRNVIAVSGDDGRALEVPGAQGGPELSPDGRWLAYHSNVSGQSEVYVVSFPDLAGPWRLSEYGGFGAEWGAQGGELFYVSLEREMVSVRLRTEEVPTVVDREVLFQVPQNYHVDPTADFYAVSRDGQRFLMGATDRNVLSRIGRLRLVRNWLEVVVRATSN